MLGRLVGKKTIILRFQVDTSQSKNIHHQVKETYAIMKNNPSLYS